LGFARLFASAGVATPLILDDALVYCDDDRMAAMCAVLQSASQHHQVLVLTCRERAFSNLTGQRVQLTPWMSAAAA
jgi:uncharacterized protein YhaN